MDDKLQILKKSGDLFMKYGIRSISMDEIARENGVSKKTLYQYFDNKADLIYQCLVVDLELDKLQCKAICAKQENPVHQLLLIGQHVIQKLRTINPTTFMDLQKYYPKCWDLFDKKHMNQFIRDSFLENMEKGIEMGYYHKQLDNKIVTRFYLARMDVMLSRQVFPPESYKIQTIYRESMKYHIYAISTEKGKQYLEANIHLLND